MDITCIPMTRGFINLSAGGGLVQRAGAGVAAFNPRGGRFLSDAVEEALAKHRRPDMFNTDRKNDGVGSFAAIWSHQATNCPRIAGTARCLGRSDPNTDRPGFVSFPGSVGG